MAMQSRAKICTTKYLRKDAVDHIPTKDIRHILDLKCKPLADAVSSSCDQDVGHVEAWHLLSRC